MMMFTIDEAIQPSNLINMYTVV